MVTSRFAFAVFATAALAAAGADAASDADLLRCRALADGAARLACYDGLPVSPAGSAPASPAAPAAAAVAPPATPAAPAAQFGFEDKTVKQTDAIESRIVGLFEGWGPHTQFKLENGQVWQVSDDSRSLAVPTQNPKVRISRATFGTFFLEVEGKRAAPRVKRVE